MRLDVVVIVLELLEQEPDDPKLLSPSDFEQFKVWFRGYCGA